MSNEKFGPKTLRIFRQVARAVSGESLEPGENDVVLFGRTSGHKTGIVHKRDFIIHFLEM